MKAKKVYLSGKITGDIGFKKKFKEAEQKLKAKGHKVMNPAILPEGFEYEEYMAICFAMIDQCNILAFLPDWEDSPGAKREIEYAVKTKKLPLRIESLLMEGKEWHG